MADIFITYGVAFSERRAFELSRPAFRDVMGQGFSYRICDTNFFQHPGSSFFK
jgi:hypothetical protein